eukprot:3969868-Karenia_brevis.AAC.1
MDKLVGATDKLKQSLGQAVQESVDRRSEEFVTVASFNDKLAEVVHATQILDVLEPLLRTHADKQMASLQRTTDVLAKDLHLLFEKNEKNVDAVVIKHRRATAGIHQRLKMLEADLKAPATDKHCSLSGPTNLAEVNRHYFGKLQNSMENHGFAEEFKAALEVCPAASELSSCTSLRDSEDHEGASDEDDDAMIEAFVKSL